MKRSKYVQLSLAASVALAISGEVVAQEQLRRFQSVEQCVDAEVAADACSNAYVAALTEHRRIAPAYDDKAACDADFAADWCQKNSAGRFVPKLGGFKLPSEPAQDLDALAAAQMSAGEAAATQTTQSTSHSSGGSGNGWLTGWLIGNAMSNNNRSNYDSRPVYRERNTRQTYDTSTLNRRIESAPTTRSEPDYNTSRSKPVNVASSTSRGGFGSQSSARSGWGGGGGSSS